MSERQIRSTESPVRTLPEHMDDASVRYAIDGAVAWAAMAFSRALVEERRRTGDPLFDRLLAVQRELTELRDAWAVGRGG